MAREDVLNKLNEVFREVFDNEDITIYNNTNIKDIDGWDSLINITLISEIEDAFDIMFDMKDISNMQSIDSMINKIMELL